MYNMVVKNVNEALPMGIDKLLKEGIERDSRAGRVLEIPGPFVTTYIKPWERVLFSKIRDANPFFHLFESLWILAGRNDVKWISEYNSIINQFSDDDVVFHGAYGKRLRGGKTDQIKIAIELLLENENDRRVVLQIWDKTEDLRVKSKDIPCNDLIFLKIRDGHLYMTVCCRSNDIIWGCYGANVVQFSILQEYIASMVGINMGSYTQISDSYHAYIGRKDWEQMKTVCIEDWYTYPWSDSIMEAHRLVNDTDSFDQELHCFMGGIANNYKNKFFSDVAIPMQKAWRAHREAGYGYRYLIHETSFNVDHNDWIFAALQWLKKREG